MPVTNYIYNPLTEAYLMETDGDGKVTARYTHEPVKYGDILAQHRIDQATGVGESFYYHTDALGSTRELTDASGNVVNTYTYDAFGNTIASTGTVENPFRFTGNVGYYFDPELQTYHIRARNYQPTTGRWTSQDPIGFAGGINLYGAYFVPNATDPSGLVTGRPRTCRGVRYNIAVQGCCIKYRLGPPKGRGYREQYTVSETLYSLDSQCCNQGIVENCQKPLPGTFGGVGAFEVQFFVGGGGSSVMCKDKCGNIRIMTFGKLCLGGAVGASYAGQVTYLAGGCDPSSYSGWFYELGFSAGPVSGGVDVGYDGMPDTRIPGLGIPIPGVPSGTGEGGLGVGPGLKVKSTWCYYWLSSDITVNSSGATITYGSGQK